MKRIIDIFLLLLVIGFASCRQPAVPKPYGHFRIAIPDTAYSRYAPSDYPYAFLLSDNAVVEPHNYADERYWINIQYPSINATIHCTYKPIQDNLRALLRDAQDFLYGHVKVASAMPEQEFAHPEQRVWGVLYELQGDVATPMQFVLTDSIEHFFRASVYCNTTPNQDSLAPIYDYLRQDVRTLMESIRWQ
jgi:gliding motility-associated lipoprotein GldD